MNKLNSIFRRTASLLLAAVMLVSLLPMGAAAQDDVPVCAALEGCADGAHNTDCPLYTASTEEPKDNTPVCAALEGCADGAHNTACPLYVAPVSCDLTENCQAADHSEGCAKAASDALAAAWAVVEDMINALPTPEEVKKYNEEERQAFHTNSLKPIYDYAKEHGINLDDNQTLNAINDALYSPLPLVDPEGVDTSWYNDTDTSFTISTVEQLRGLAYLVNNGNTFKDKTVNLGASIDLKNEAWTPIGTSSSKFFGTFNGGGNTISNLTVSGTEGVGLFGYAGQGSDVKNITTITNLTLNNVNVSGTKYVGGLVGSAFVVNLTNCRVTGSVTVAGTQYVGGLMGGTYARVTNCSVVDTTADGGSVTSSNQVGGLIGILGGDGNVITGSKAENLTVSATGTWVGGLIGQINERDMIIGNSVSGVTVTAASDGYGGLAGLLVGYNIAETKPTYLLNNQVSSATGTINGQPLTTETGTRPDDAYTIIGTDVTLDANKKVVSGNLTRLPEPHADYLAANSELKDNGDGTFSVTHYVAAIGDKKYETLADALTAATAGDTIILLEDVTEDFTLTKALTLALGDHALKAKITIPTALELTITGAGTGSDITLTAPSREGFVFGGWYADEAFSEDQAAARKGDDYVALPGNTYYPKWNYSVSFDGNGADSGTVAALTAAQGGSVTLPENGFVRTGYSFTGWNTSADGSGTDYAAGATPSFPANTTLYAQWEVNQYTITFVTGDGSVVAPITKNYGAAVTAPAAPTREGYSFAGWDKTIPATMPAENMTITARWNVNQYTITFANTGDTTIRDIKQDFGSTVTAPGNPTKTGYTFAGWDKTIPATMPAENMTITARWNVNKYEVVFHANGGEGTMANQEFTYGTAQNLSTNTFTYANKNFAGWSTTETGSVAYADGVRVYNLSTADGEQIHLYAVWTDKEVLTPDLSVQTYTYNGKPQGFQLEGGYTITYSRRSTTAPTDAGVYDVTITKAATDTTAAFSTTIPGGLVIQRAILTATYVGETIYVGTTPAMKITVTGFVNGETANSAAGYVAPIVDKPGTAQGTYTLTPYGGEADNYAFTYVSGKLVIKVKTPYQQDPDKLTQTGSTTGPGMLLMAAGLVALCAGALFIPRRKKGRYEG